MARSENGYGFYRSGLKVGVENYMFGLKSGQDLENRTAGTPPPRIPRNTPSRGRTKFDVRYFWTCCLRFLILNECYLPCKIIL